MTKCLFKALKAVDLEKHVGLFRSLGYESAGALAHFHTEHFEKLNFNEHELLRLLSLLDVLKDSTREGKICPHYFKSSKPTKTQPSTIKSAPPIRASWSDETIQHKNSQSNIRKPTTGRSSSVSMASIKNLKNSANDFLSPRTSTVLSRQHPNTPTKNSAQKFLGPKALLNKPTVQHIKVKSYNYGVPTTSRRSRNSFHRPNFHHGSIFVSSSHHHHNHENNSCRKPAEIYVYARKRPLLSTENNFQDSITLSDTKRIIIAENKANLDCSPLIKKTEFQFDQVFGADISNREIFETTVLPFISPNHRHNLTYICFGQTGSGKSHTIFGSKNTDGLLIYCTQLLLKETVSLENNLVGSFYEIYNNQVYDLMNTGKRLFVREDGEHQVNIIGITEVDINKLDDLRCIIDNGLAQRHHGKSAFNSNSSRSHAVFQIILKNNYDSSEVFRLIFIDLAGSERATDAQNNLRQTRREGAQINCSLLALKECIRSMDMTHSHAPFRQSKLTHILRDSLVGTQTRTCLMANVSPADDCCQCSLNTLQYASRIRDISLRHRHRSMPVPNLSSMHYIDDIIQEHEKVPQRNFKPVNSSTPVHKLISSMDQRIHPTSDIDTHLTKPLDIDWQIADDDDDNDTPISSNRDNNSLKGMTSATREFMISSNNNSHPIQLQSSKTNNPPPESPSSYFPQPQTDIKKTSSNKTSNDIKRSFDPSHLLYDNGNERQWKTVPAPTTTNRYSDSSIEPPSNPIRIIPIVPLQISDDNPYNSGTGTESLGTKITKMATNSHRKQYDTTDTDQLMYTDRSDDPKVHTDFYNNREKLLSIVSSRLTPVSRRSSSASTTRSSKINSSHLNKSKYSPTKTRQKTTRLIKSSSSNSSIASTRQEKKSSIENKKPKIPSTIPLHKIDPTIRRSPNRHQQHQRSVPLRAHHSSDSEEPEKLRQHNHRRKVHATKPTLYSTRHEAPQTMNNIQIKKNEQAQTNQQNYIEKSLSLVSPDIVPNALIQAPLDQIKLAVNRSLQQPISPLSSVNINNPWPITTPFSTSTSPSKEFGARVSNQLNALRTLLENRLIDEEEPKYKKKESTILQTSPATFARDFLQSLRQSSFPNDLTNNESDIEDDDDKEVERNFHSNNNNNNEKIKSYEAEVLTTSTTSSNQHGYSSIHHHQHYEPITLSDELNQARISSSVASPSSSTITSNLAAKIDTHDPRILSSDNQSQQTPKKNYHTANDTQGINGNISHPTSDSERTSDVNFTSQNLFTGPSDDSSSSNNSRSHSPAHMSPLNTYERSNRTSQNHDHDNPYYTSPSFDELLNSLKNIRERDLEFVVHANDDKLIPVAD